jgi:hypothetical protein
MLTDHRTAIEDARNYDVSTRNGEAFPADGSSCPHDQDKPSPEEFEDSYFDWKRDAFRMIEGMSTPETPEPKTNFPRQRAKYSQRDIIDQGLRQRFEGLVSQWQEATAFTSSVVEMAMHPAYQQIIGLGPAAIPLLLNELEREPDHWFWALRAIAGENPVPVEDAGRVLKMAAVWVEWGRDRGYI